MGRSRGFRGGTRGRGIGLGRRFWREPQTGMAYPDVEKSMLKARAEELKASLAEIEDRLAKIDRPDSDPNE